MALIPPEYLDCVVAIGVERAGVKHWVASGFLYGHFLREIDEGAGRYVVYVVTNAHVVKGQKAIHLRFNPRGGSRAREYALPFEGVEKPAIVKRHAEVDLAVIPIDANVLDRDGIQFEYFQSNKDVAGRERLEEMGVSEGDFGYILGFPMGLVGEERDFVIVRQGTIARIRDYLAGAQKEFLMDCLIFPGNSGGPVVTKPESVAVRGTKRVSGGYLIGVVARTLNYREEARSVQTGRTRVVFEDNSGLASVIPVQYLMDLAGEVQGIEGWGDDEEVAGSGG